MPALTRSLRSSTRLAQAPASDEMKSLPGKTKDNAKSQVKKGTAEKIDVEKTAPKQTARGRKRKAAEEPEVKEEEPKGKVTVDEPKQTPAKKAKVSLLHSKLLFGCSMLMTL